MEPLFHIARRADWERARRDGAYRVSTLGRTLEQEGFIHLSFAHQVPGVARRFYRDEPDLVLLELDPAALRAELRVEPVPGGDERFPHLYGPLPPDAVVAASSFDPEAP
jgi:uncharacterized protein (DUF952 family)